MRLDPLQTCFRHSNSSRLARISLRPRVAAADESATLSRRRGRASIGIQATGPQQLLRQRVASSAQPDLARPLNLDQKLGQPLCTLSFACARRPTPGPIGSMVPFKPREIPNTSNSFQTDFRSRLKPSIPALRALQLVKQLPRRLGGQFIFSFRSDHPCAAGAAGSTRSPPVVADLLILRAR